MSQIDHETERAEARWQALVAQIDQATAADYVCDQLRALLMTPDHPMCKHLGEMCADPPDLWNMAEIPALMKTLEAAELGRALVQTMTSALVQYIADLSIGED